MPGLTFRWVTKPSMSATDLAIAQVELGLIQVPPRPARPGPGRLDRGGAGRGPLDQGVEVAVRGQGVDPLDVGVGRLVVAGQVQAEVGEVLHEGRQGADDRRMVLDQVGQDVVERLALGGLRGHLQNQSDPPDLRLRPPCAWALIGQPDLDVLAGLSPRRPSVLNRSASDFASLSAARALSSRATAARRLATWLRTSVMAETSLKWFALARAAVARACASSWASDRRATRSAASACSTWTRSTSLSRRTSRSPLRTWSLSSTRTATTVSAIRGRHEGDVRR